MITESHLVYTCSDYSDASDASDRLPVFTVMHASDHQGTQEMIDLLLPLI